jgi:hypothetical protein
VDGNACIVYRQQAAGKVCSLIPRLFYITDIVYHCFTQSVSTIEIYYYQINYCTAKDATTRLIAGSYKQILLRSLYQNSPMAEIAAFTSEAINHYSTEKIEYHMKLSMAPSLCYTESNPEFRSLVPIEF